MIACLLLLCAATAFARPQSDDDYDYVNQLLGPSPGDSEYIDSSEIESLGIFNAPTQQVDECNRNHQRECKEFADNGYQCVSFSNCEDGEIITDGIGLINIRSGLLGGTASIDPTASKCAGLLEVCCRHPDQTHKPVPELCENTSPPQPPPNPACEAGQVCVLESICRNGVVPSNADGVIAGLSSDTSAVYVCEVGDVCCNRPLPPQCPVGKVCAPTCDRNGFAQPNDVRGNQVFRIRIDSDRCNVGEMCCKQKDDGPPCAGVDDGTQECAITCLETGDFPINPRLQFGSQQLVIRQLLDPRPPGFCLGDEQCCSTGLDPVGPICPGLEAETHQCAAACDADEFSSVPTDDPTGQAGFCRENEACCKIRGPPCPGMKLGTHECSCTSTDGTGCIDVRVFGIPDFCDVNQQCQAKTSELTEHGRGPACPGAAGSPRTHSCSHSCEAQVFQIRQVDVDLIDGRFCPEEDHFCCQLTTPPPSCTRGKACADECDTQGRAVSNPRGGDVFVVRQDRERCNFGQKCCLKPYTPICGQRNREGVAARITSGALKPERATQFGEWPHMCALMERKQITQAATDLYQCGASLILPGVALTAAHCVKKVTGDIRIRCGEWDTQQQNEPVAHQEIAARNVTVHPLYNENNLQHDVALIYLEQDFRLGPTVDTICLPQNADSIDLKGCVAAGWGKDRFGKEGDYQVVLRGITMDMVANADCQNKLRNTRLGNFFKLHESFACAGGKADQDTCTGDGGSPLVCREKTPGIDLSDLDGVIRISTGPDRWVQTGIVAWGIDCGLPDVPGVYASITDAICFMDWDVKCKGQALPDDVDVGHCNGWARKTKDKTRQEIRRIEAKTRQRASDTRQIKRLNEIINIIEGQENKCNARSTRGK